MKSFFNIDYIYINPLTIVLQVLIRLGVVVEVVVVVVVVLLLLLLLLNPFRAMIVKTRYLEYEASHNTNILIYEYAFNVL